MLYNKDPAPKAVLPLPVVLAYKAAEPNAEFSLPVVLLAKTLQPVPVLSSPLPEVDVLEEQVDAAGLEKKLPLEKEFIANINPKNNIIFFINNNP